MVDDHLDNGCQVLLVGQAGGQGYRVKSETACNGQKRQKPSMKHGQIAYV